MDASTQPMARPITGGVYHTAGDEQIPGYIWVHIWCHPDNMRICTDDDPDTLKANAEAFEAIADRLRGIAEEIETGQAEAIETKDEDAEKRAAEFAAIERERRTASLMSWH